MLARVARVQGQLISSWDVLATMTPSEYSAVRPHLGASSGFQSAQYRMVEFILGGRDAAHVRSHEDTPEVAQALRDELPVEVRAEQQAACHPSRLDAGLVGEPGQPHQQPAAHVGGLCRQRGDPAAEPATAQDEITERTGAPVGDEAEQQADRHVGDQARDDAGVVFDHVSPEKGSVPFFCQAKKKGTDPD